MVLVDSYVRLLAGIRLIPRPSWREISCEKFNRREENRILTYPSERHWLPLLEPIPHFVPHGGLHFWCWSRFQNVKIYPLSCGGTDVFTKSSDLAFIAGAVCRQMLDGFWNFNGLLLCVDQRIRTHSSCVSFSFLSRLHYCCLHPIKRGSWS